MIEVLVPGREQQQERVGCGVQFAQQVVPERSDRETEFRERRIARMAPGPGGGE